MPQKYAVVVCAALKVLTLVQKRIFDISGSRRSVVEAFALLGCYFLSLKM